MSKSNLLFDDGACKRTHSARKGMFLVKIVSDPVRFRKPDSNNFNHSCVKVADHLSGSQFLCIAFNREVQYLPVGVLFFNVAEPNESPVNEDSGARKHQRSQ